jgi:hypothetical protein
MDYKTEDDVITEMSAEAMGLERRLVEKNGNAYSSCPDCDPSRGASGSCETHARLYELRHDIRMLTERPDLFPNDADLVGPAPSFA